MSKETAEPKKRRNPAKNHPWKGIYGIDQKFTARVDRLAERKAAKSE